MISVVVEYVNDDFSFLQIDGHGGEENGYDIYCAGVSSCLIGALNALEKGEDYFYEISSGHSLVRAKAKPNRHDAIVLETLICQLETISNSYPERVNCKISKKEGKL